MKRKEKREEELHEEIRNHLKMAAQERVERGAAAEDAAYAARQEFGNVELVKEVTRDTRGWRWLEDFAQDVVYGLRMLRKDIAFTAVLVLTLAVGLGANTTIFSWIRVVLLDPLPGAAEPERVVELESLAPSGEWVPTSYLDFRDFREHTKLLESMSVAQPIALAVGNDVHVERVWGEVVSGNFFDVLHVQPELGRFFTGEERNDAENAHPVVVLSHAYWRSRYGSNPQAIGATVRINRTPYTIIGVAPENFHGSMAGLSFDLWAPATMYGQLTATGTWMLRDRKARMFRVLARLAPEVSIEQARAEVQSFTAFMSKANADTSEGMSATLLPIWKSHYGIQGGLLAPLSILMGASGVVLLIVCANVANLLLARAADRRKEFSIRIALGAGPMRLVRQLSTEVLLVASAGSLAGLVITAWLSGALRWLLPLTDAPKLVAASIDGGVLLFTAGLALAVATLAGLAPALHAARENVNDTLKESGRSGSASLRSNRLRALLVASEMALAVVTLIGAGLFLKSFYIAKGIHPGFDPNQVALTKFNFSAAGFDAQQADAFCGHLREQLERQPGVAAVSYADYVPLSLNAGSWEDLQVEGYVPGRSENMKIYRNLVAPGFFSLLKIPLLEGRDITMQDDASHPKVMVVTREFVRRFVPSGSVLGRKVHGWGEWFTIVGVVDDVKINRLTEKPAPYFYVPVRQIYRPEMGLAFYVRTSGSVNEALAALRREAQAVDGMVPISDVTSMNDYIGVSLFAQKIAANLLSILAGIAFLLASNGLYGVMAYSVAQRTNEIGIRMTLGAQPKDVLRLIAKQGLTFALAGTVVGAIVALLLARLVNAFLVTVSPADPLIYAAVAVITMALALAATAIPARRATRVDPMVALRYE
jgi:putative ABC transport system permease protein